MRETNLPLEEATNKIFKVRRKSKNEKLHHFASYILAKISPNSLIFVKIRLTRKFFICWYFSQKHFFDKYKTSKSQKHRKKWDIFSVFENFSLLGKYILTRFFVFFYWFIIFSINTRHQKVKNIEKCDIFSLFEKFRLARKIHCLEFYFQKTIYHLQEGSKNEKTNKNEK